MKELFTELYTYNQKTNESLIIAIQKINDPDDRLVDLLNHVLNAHHIWNHRILGQPERLGPFERSPKEHWVTLNNDNHIISNKLLSDHPFDQEYEYKNLKGKIFTNTLRDILFHVINHSTYHRGQIATRMRETGIEPLITDFISYKR